MMTSSSLEKAFGKVEANKLKELWNRNHTELGDDLLVKMHKFFPEIRTERWASSKDGILWWILHNQIEVVFRFETCREILFNLADKQVLSRDIIKDHLVELVVALDHLKQNLVFLISDLDSHSYYVLDASLEANCFSIKDAKKHGRELIKTFAKNDRDNCESDEVSFEVLRATLAGSSVDNDLSVATLDSLSDLLSSADNYCAELKAFISSDKNLTIVFSNFRRVIAEGMKLLSHVILAETAIRTLRLHL